MSPAFNLKRAALAFSDLGFKIMMIAERETEKEREREVVLLFFMFLIAMFKYSLDILVRRS